MPIIGKFVSYAVVGVPPELNGNSYYLANFKIKGIGPIYAIPKALQ